MRFKLHMMDIPHLNPIPKQNIRPASPLTAKELALIGQQANSALILLQRVNSSPAVTYSSARCPIP